MPSADAVAITIDQQGCARCDGPGHPALTFEPLTIPVYDNGVVFATHWAACPYNGEPILLVQELTS